MMSYLKSVENYKWVMLGSAGGTWQGVHKEWVDKCATT